MERRDEMDRASAHLAGAGDDMNRASRDLGRAADHAGDALSETRQGLEAGASGVMERATHRLDDAAHAAAGTVDRARHAAGDALHDATGAVKGAVSDAGHRIADEATAIRAAAGEKLDSVRGPLVGSALGALVGVLAGALGGWWAGRAMAGADHELPEEHEEACRVHFLSYTVRPAGMEYDDARPGYLLGYVASRNPDYQGRSYDEVERDLRTGFTDDYATRYDALRDYARYGYERGATGW